MRRKRLNASSNWPKNSRSRENPHQEREPNADHEV
jgi:hypothetical protein